MHVENSDHKVPENSAFRLQDFVAFRWVFFTETSVTSLRGLVLVIIVIKIFIEIYSQGDVRSVQFNTNKNKIKLIRSDNTMVYYIKFETLDTR